MRATPAEADLTPGSPSLFSIELSNAGLIDQPVVLQVPTITATWTYTLSSDTVTVPANGTARVTLTLRAPESAAVGSLGEATVTSKKQGTDLEAAPPVTLRARVVAPPASDSPSAPAAPKIAVVGGETTVAPGEIARGTLTVLNGDVTPYNVNVAIAGTTWSARIDGLTLLRVHPDETRDFPLLADVPASTANGTVRTFDVTATVDSHVVHTTWKITVLGEPTEAAPAGEPAQTGDGTSTPDGDATDVPDAPTDAAAPEITLGAASLGVPAGSGTRSILRLANPTLDATTIRLAGEAPEGWLILFDTDAVHLPPGEVKDIGYEVRAPADAIPGGTGQAAILATPRDAPTQRLAFEIRPLPALVAQPDTTPTAQRADASGTVPIPAPQGESVVILGAALGLGLVGAGVVVVANRPLREKLLWAGVGLYTRLARPDVLTHEERERLHAIIQEKPGIHFHALQRELDWNTGTLTYHLRVLERHSFVVSRRDGLLRRFYISGAAPRQETFEGPSGLRADVLEAIRGRDGISQSDLTLALGANKQTVNYHVKALEKQGAIRIEKRGRDTYLYANGELPATRATSASA